MRNVFSEELYKQAKKNKKIDVIVSDISPAGSMEDFRKKYPKRFINVGVAEQVMIGLSAGLALRGRRPFAYTIATFALFRPFEMVRDDICYQNLPVTIVGMGAGTIYANLGGTHLAQEDISIAKSLPNMSVIAPIDPNELREAVKFCANKAVGPVYLRIGKAGEKNFSHLSNQKWEFGKIRNLIRGKDVCFLTYGPIIKLVDKVVKKLKSKKINPSIYNCHTLKPLDKKTLKKIFSKYKIIVTVEDHSIINGLAQDVKSLAFDFNYKGKIQNYALEDKFSHSYEKQEDILDLNDIKETKIIKNIIKCL